MRNRISALLLGLCLTWGVCFSQGRTVYYTEAQVKALLKEDPYRAANFHHVYEVPKEAPGTRAPRGFKPFYVSHYGRHGCRYLADAAPLESVLSRLQELDSLGQLTAEGKKVFEDAKFLQEKQSGMVGMLTRKGAATQRGIAARLAARYPQIFSRKKTGRVRAISTTFERCILSMSNFVLALEENTSGLDISMDTGQRYIYTLVHPLETPRPIGDRYLEQRDSVFRTLFDPSRLSAILFKDPSALRTHFPGEEYDFFHNLFLCFEMGPCLDFEAPDLLSRLTPDELYAHWAYSTILMVGGFGRTVENEGYACRQMGDAIVQDFLARTQEAVDKGKVCADFRFGHDTGLVSFLFQIRIDGYHETFSTVESLHKWLGFQHVPMASNIQFVFFRNRKGKVLVKALVNEQERTFPGLEAVNGVYYEWPVLKNYLESLPV